MPFHFPCPFIRLLSILGCFAPFGQGSISAIPSTSIETDLDSTQRAPRLFLAGDSTMAPKPPPPANPERGWGEALEAFFAPSLVVENRALNGRSSLSFRTVGHWDRLLADLRPGDTVLIQFGHNDAKAEDPSRYAEAWTQYRSQLETFVTEVRARQAVPLLDLKKATASVVEALGPKNSKNFYLWPTSGQFARFPEGKEDDTHLSVFGTSIVAQLTAQAIQSLDSPLRPHLKPHMPDFTKITWQPLFPAGLLPTDPDGGEEFTENDRVHNVRQPSLGAFHTTVGHGPRPAVVVCPGGGYNLLAIKHEGKNIARWFNALG